MSNTEIIMIAILGVTLITLAIRVFGGSPHSSEQASHVDAVRGAAHSPSATLHRQPLNPGRAIIDHVDEIGRDRAGYILEDRLGNHRARQMIAQLVEAISSETQSPNEKAKPAT